MNLNSKEWIELTDKQIESMEDTGYGPISIADASLTLTQTVNPGRPDIYSLPQRALAIHLSGGGGGTAIILRVSDGPTYLVWGNRWFFQSILNRSHRE